MAGSPASCSGARYFGVPMNCPTPVRSERQVVEPPGDAEIGELHTTVRSEQHVARLDVAVDDPCGMGRAERGQDRILDVQRLIDRERGPIGEQLGE